MVGIKHIMIVSLSFATLVMGVYGIEQSYHHKVHQQNAPVKSYVKVSEKQDAVSSLKQLAYTPTQQEHVTGAKSEEKPPVKQLTKEFKDRLIQKTDGHFYVKNFKTKKSFINYLSEIMDKQLAKKFVDHYYTETNGKLKVIPTEFIPWFQSTSPYQLKKMSSKSYQLIQHNKSDLHGTYTLAITFKKQTEHWKITEVKINDYTI